MEAYSLVDYTGDNYNVLRIHHRAPDTILGDWILSLWMLGHVVELER